MHYLEGEVVHCVPPRGHVAAEAVGVGAELLRRLERDQLHTMIKWQFRLDEATADELMAKATKAEHDAVDLYHFTSLINRSLDENGRRRVVEMMWEMIYADGHVTEFERNLIWRVADLLGISSRERIELGQRVASQSGTDSA